MRNWKNDPITEKQNQMIARIEEDAMMNNAFIPPFDGKTKGDACDYINKYIHASHISAFNLHGDAGDRV